MEETLEKLRIQLNLQDWPNVYYFKFIIPNVPEKIAKLSALFDDSGEIVMHPSKNGNYISISAKEMMLDVESILDKYRKASLIEGIISL